MNLQLLSSCLVIAFVNLNPTFLSSIRFFHCFLFWMHSSVVCGSMGRNFKETLQRRVVPHHLDKFKYSF